MFHEVLTRRSRRPFTVYAISKDLGAVDGTPTDPVVWAIGMLRDPVVQFATATGAVEQRLPYWRSKFSQDQDIVCLQLG